MSAQAEDIQVLPADQQRINRFSHINLRLKELDGEIDTLKARMTTCNDALEEAEMCLDPDGMLLSVGESFFTVTEDEAIEYLDKAKSATEDLLTKYRTESSTLQTELVLLKETLYAKFGTAINLEDK